MTAVSLQCKLMNHHPEWSNVSYPTSVSRASKWETGANKIGLQHHLHPVDNAQSTRIVSQGYCTCGDL